MRTGKLWAAFRPYLWITLASAVFALGFDWCYVPNQITLGGMTGLGQIIHAIVPAIPVGSAVIALNLPLFLLGWRLLGWKLLASSLFATAATSLGVDLLAACYSFPPMDPMLASVFGGALIGLSLGMVFLQGATTGGTDLIARLLKLRFGHLPMGTLVMAVDLVVIALAASAVTWLVTGAIIRAVTILVVFCPCALVLATPTAIMAAIGNATRHSFLVREGVFSFKRKISVGRTLDLVS